MVKLGKIKSQMSSSRAFKDSVGDLAGLVCCPVGHHPESTMSFPQVATSNSKNRPTGAMSNAKTLKP